MKTNFYMKGWAPRLALKKRLKVIRKWSIALSNITVRFTLEYFPSHWELLVVVLFKSLQLGAFFFFSSVYFKLNTLYQHPEKNNILIILSGVVSLLASFLLLSSSTCSLLRPRPHVSGYFWIRNFFFPDTAIVHTHTANSQANPEIFESALQSGNFWIR